MNVRHLTAASVALVLAWIMISWKPSERSSPPLETSTGVNAKTVSASRDGRGPDLAAAFVFDPDSLSDEDYQFAARAYEEEKRTLRAKNKRPAPPADRNAPYRRWSQRVEKVQEMINACEEFPVGSVQWHMREELEQLLEDKPRRP